MESWARKRTWCGKMAGCTACCDTLRVGMPSAQMWGRSHIDVRVRRYVSTVMCLIVEMVGRDATVLSAMSLDHVVKSGVGGFFFIRW